MPHGQTGFEGSPEIGGSRRDPSGLGSGFDPGGVDVRDLGVAMRRDGGEGGRLFPRRRDVTSPPRFSEAELAAEKARRDLLRLTAAQGRGSTAFASLPSSRTRADPQAGLADPGSAIFREILLRIPEGEQIFRKLL